MTLRQYDYSRDPCDILIDRQEAAARRSCVGCIHTLIVFDKKICEQSVVNETIQ